MVSLKDKLQKNNSLSPPNVWPVQFFLHYPVKNSLQINVTVIICLQQQLETR